jgi:hypothetical protein
LVCDWPWCVQGLKKKCDWRKTRKTNESAHDFSNSPQEEAKASPKPFPKHYKLNTSRSINPRTGSPIPSPISKGYRFGFLVCYCKSCVIVIYF